MFIFIPAMNSVRHYVPLHLSLFLVSGILSGFLFQGRPGIFMGISFLMLMGLIAIYFWSKKHYSKRILFQLLSYVLVFYVGFIQVLLQLPAHQKKHYAHFINPENTVVFYVTNILKPSNYYRKYIVKIQRIDRRQSLGKLLLYVQKDTAATPLEPGKYYAVHARIQKPQARLNPYTFDYASYLKKQGIYYQIKTRAANISDLILARRSLRKTAYKIKEQIKNNLASFPFSRQESAIIYALILGERQDVSKNLLEDYAGAGAIHILAVSGLHVGIWYLILSFLCKPLEKRKYGKIIRLLLILTILWAYALLTGLSASVVRAVSMFSFIAVGKTGKRQTNNLQALITSFFLLLLIHPLYLFDVGFQMSYTAVLAIILFYPVFYGFFPETRLLLLQKIFQLSSLSTAASIGTFPLSLYYFHQFPGLFIISNLLIVPLLGIIMSLGIGVVFLAYFNIIPEPLAYILAFLIRNMNHVVRLLAAQKEFLLQNLHFSFPSVLLSYLFLAGIYLWWWYKNRKSKLIVLGISALFLTYLIYEKRQSLQQNEVWAFHKTKATILAEVRGNSLQISASIDTAKQADTYVVKALKVAKNIRHTHKVLLKDNILKYHNDNILIIDSLGVCPRLPFKVQTLYLRDSPRINLVRVIEQLHPERIIADGSNYTSYRLRWQKTCHKKQVDFYATAQQGAFRFP